MLFYLLIFILGLFVGSKLWPYLMAWDIKYNNCEALKNCLNSMCTESYYEINNFTEEEKRACNNFKDTVNEFAVKIESVKSESSKTESVKSESSKSTAKPKSRQPNKYDKENIFREKQEIIKRNTAKETHCGLCEAGECKYINYCKHQRNYTEYGCEKVVLCMREGKSE